MEHGQPARSRRSEALRSIAAAWLVLVAAAALAGVLDLAANARGFSRLEALETELLWIGLGGLLGALAILGFRRSLAIGVVWTGLQGALVLMFRGGWIGFGAALPLMAAVAALAVWLARREDLLAAVRRPCALVLLASVLASAFLGGGGEAAAPARARRTAVDSPNVVLVVLDTLRADHVGAYGDARGLTPSLDALAARSTLYEQAYATAPWTIPSHASLFTGLFPASHGATTVRHRWLDDRFTTLAEALQAVGYDTAAFSANHYLAEGNLAQGFDLYRPLGDRFDALRIRPFLLALGWPAKWADHGAAEGVEAVERFLDGRTGSPAPLFLFVNLMEPHWRYLPPCSDRGALLPPDVGVLEATRISAEVYGPLLMAGKKVGGSVEAPVEAVIRALYAAAVRYQDRELGRMLAAIDRALDPQRTILVVTSDHGENLGEAGRFDHVFAVNDHLIRVPLIVRYPPASEPVPRGAQRVAGICQLVDVPVTIAALVPGVELGAGVAGRTLAPASFEPRRFAIAEGDPYYGHLERMSAWTGFRKDVGAYAQPLLALRSADRKLVVRARREALLFDVATDPDETQDLSRKEPAMVEELLKALADALSALEPYRPEKAGAAEPSPLQREALDRLRRTGYAGEDG